MNLPPALATFSIALVLAGSLALPVSAHTLKADRDIGAVLHIDPNDDPVATQPSTLFFDIKDRAAGFSLAGCQCQMSVLQGSAQLYSAGLAAAGSSATATYAFPAAGVYQVRLYGTPAAPGQFQPFSLTWDIRVEPGLGSPASLAPFGRALPFVFFGTLIFSLGVIFAWNAIRRPPPGKA